VSFKLNQYVYDLIFIYQTFWTPSGRIHLSDFIECIVHVLLLDFKQLFIFNFLKHAVKTIFNAVLCAPGQLLHYLRPPVANLLSELQNLQVLLWAKRLAIDLWVEEVVPSLSALLTVPLYTKGFIKCFCDLLPLLCSFLRDYAEQLIIFALLPLGFRD
jgi:hypothetical protein